MKPGSPLVQALLTSAPRRMTAMWSVECPFVPLGSSWKEFRMSRLSGNFRRNLDRRLRKLEREAPGPVTFDTVSADPGIDETMTQLIHLHDAVRRRNGQSGAFDSGVRRQFYRDVARRFSERGWLRLHRLSVDGRPVSLALCFAYGPKVSLYQMGYNLEWGRYGPGYLIGRYLVESAIESGASEVDWLRGGHPYKYEWNADQRSIVKLRLGCSTAGGVVAPMTRWLRAAKSGWKGLRDEH
jgi:CelD/BcsL family acetyltransferase involved in cellulose biosynthesis